MKPILTFGFVLLVLVAARAAESAKTTEKTCYQGGSLVFAGSGNSYSSPVYNAKGTAVILSPNYTGTKFSVLDLKTRVATEYSKPPNSSVDFKGDDELVFTDFSALSMGDIKSIVATLKVATVKVQNLRTGATTQLVGKFFLAGDLVSVDRSEGSSSLVLKDQSGHERTVQVMLSGATSQPDEVSRFSSDYSEPDVKYNRKAKRLSVSENGKVIFKTEVEMKDATNVGGTFSPDRRYFILGLDTNGPVTPGTASRLQIVDLKMGRGKTISLPPGYSGGNLSSSTSSKKVSADSKTVLLDSYSSPNEGAKLLSLETGEMRTLSPPGGATSHEQITDANYDSKGNICYSSMRSVSGFGVESPKASFVCLDETSGKEVSRIEAPLQTSSMSRLNDRDFFLSVYGNGGGQEGQRQLFSAETVCPTTITKVDCNCSVPANSGAAIETSELKKLAVAVACGKSFDAKDWKDLPREKLDTLDEAESVVVLKQFSKPGGFVPREHAGVLLGMIAADIPQKYPAEFKAALIGVIRASDVLYDTILKKYPALAKLPGAPDTSCVTASERPALEQSIRDYTKLRILTNSRPKFEAMTDLTSLARDFLPLEQRSDLAETAADQMVFTAADSAELNQIFPSKVYKFAEAKMKDALKVPFDEMTDITVVRDGENLKYIQLGVSAFEGSKETVAGFHQKLLRTKAVAELPSGKSAENFNWDYAGKKYSAEIGVNKQKLEREIVAANKSPNYEEMWKRKNFSGVVIAGVNMAPGLTEGVMKQYIDYYTGQDFTFAPPVVNKDIPKFLQSKVSGPEPMHYFVKEAHSDGDEKNLFRLGKEGKILVGTKKSNGKTETIDLIYPTSNSDSTLLSNQEFGKWMKEREAKGGPELVYLNSSCWSKSKAAYEISAAATPKFINIPTTTMMYTFSNHENNVMWATIEGLRKKKSYEQIREMMKKNEKYSSKNANVFIFPDEEDYKKKVTDVIKVPIDIDARLFVEKADGSRVDYSIEQAH